jgi:voltage-gated potassium channel
MITRLLVRFAYFLSGSERYGRIKGFFYDLLENDRYPYKRWFDFFMIFIILASVFILVIEVKEPVPKWLDDFDLYFVTSIFIIEYFLRMWVYSDVHKTVIRLHEEAQFLSQPLSLSRVAATVLKDKWSYVTTPSAIIDLIAILPSYRQIRVLRILVLFRAFKMLRYARSLSSFLFILKSKKFELVTLLTLTAFFVFIAGIMLYVFEGDNDNPNIHTLFDAFYWALITISTVGYGDISPVTPEGRVVSMLIIMTGIGLISFLTSIIVSSFGERLIELREDRVMQEVGKKSEIIVVCGFGIMGRKVAAGLEQERSELIVIDADEAAAQRAHAMGYRSICTDATRSDVFQRIGVQGRIREVLCLTSDDEQNAFIAINVKSLNAAIRVTARVSDREIADKLRYAGVDEVIIPEELAAMMGAVYAGEPVAFEAIRSIVLRHENERIDEVSVGASLAGKPLRELQPMFHRLVLLGIVRKAVEASQFHFNPDDDWTLQASDKLIVLGHGSAVDHFKRRVQ